MRCYKNTIKTKQTNYSILKIAYYADLIDDAYDEGILLPSMLEERRELGNLLQLPFLNTHAENQGAHVLKRNSQLTN